MGSRTRCTKKRLFRFIFRTPAAASQWTIWPSEDSGTVTSTAHMYFNSVGASPSCVSFWMRSGLQDTDNVPATGKPPAYRNSRDAVYAALYKQATGTWNPVKIGEYWGGGISTGSPYYYDITFTSRTTTQIVYEVVKRWSDDDSVLSDQTVTYNIPTQ